MRVLISGAGIAGPTLAWFLAKTGANITIIEKAPALLPHGQNVDIQGSARVVLKRMGLYDEVKRYNTTEKGTIFIDPQNRPFAPFPIRNDASSASFSNELEILRADLAKVFYEATKNNPKTRYVFGTTIKQVVSNNDTSVKVELSNGEIQEYDLLVAADGQWSNVRKLVFPPEEVTVNDKGMYVVYYTVPRLPHDTEWWTVYQPLGSRVITLRPDPHGTIRAMFSKMPRTDAQKQAWEEASRSDRKTQQELLRREFADAGWEAQRLLNNMDQAPDWYFHPMKQIKIAKWSKGRVVCLGDTAYAPTPLAGGGTSVAMLGAYVLAGELGKLSAGEHPSRALEAYEAVFRPHAEEVQNIPSFVPEIGHAETELKRFITRLVLRTISTIISIPLVANRLFDKGNDEDFVLPDYAFFENETAEKA